VSAFEMRSGRRY